MYKIRERKKGGKKGKMIRKRNPFVKKYVIGRCQICDKICISLAYSDNSDMLYCRQCKRIMELSRAMPDTGHNLDEWGYGICRKLEEIRDVIKGAK